MPLYEVCVAARDFGTGRASKGDVILVRDPISQIGQREKADFIWIPMDLTEAEAEAIQRAPKRAFRFSRLRDLLDDFDDARSEDPTDEYQPFYNINRRTGRARRRRSQNQNIEPNPNVKPQRRPQSQRGRDNGEL